MYIISINIPLIAIIIASQALYWIDWRFSWRDELKKLIKDDITYSNWLLINVFYVVSRVDLSKIGLNLVNKLIILLIFWVVFFICVKKFNLISSVKPAVPETELGVLVFRLNITCCTCLFKSRLKIIFH